MFDLQAYELKVPLKLNTHTDSGSSASAGPATSTAANCGFPSSKSALCNIFTLPMVPLVASHAGPHCHASIAWSEPHFGAPQYAATERYAAHCAFSKENPCKSCSWSNWSPVRTRSPPTKINVSPATVVPIPRPRNSMAVQTLDSRKLERLVVPMRP